jgi:hypothetical protein
VASRAMDPANPGGGLATRCTVGGTNGDNAWDNPVQSMRAADKQR